MSIDLTKPVNVKKPYVFKEKPFTKFEITETSPGSCQLIASKGQESNVIIFDGKTKNYITKTENFGDKVKQCKSFEFNAFLKDEKKYFYEKYPELFRIPADIKTLINADNTPNNKFWDIYNVHKEEMKSKIYFKNEKDANEKVIFKVFVK